MVVSDGEIEAIATFRGEPVDTFVETYTKLRENRQGLTLIEKPNHECVFLEGTDCTINDVKPKQCRGFPNNWNFPGWRKVCDAIPVPLNTAYER